jgi:hypothetical protein
MGFSRGSARAAQPAGDGRSSQRGGAPVCRPCTAGSHERCPTAITKHGRGEFDSDYDCPCYHEDVKEHQYAVEDADEEFYSRNSDSFGERWF